MSVYDINDINAFNHTECFLQIIFGFCLKENQEFICASFDY